MESQPQNPEFRNNPKLSPMVQTVNTLCILKDASSWYVLINLGRFDVHIKDSSIQPTEIALIFKVQDVQRSKNVDMI